TAAVRLKPFDGLNRLIRVDVERVNDRVQRRALLLRPRDGTGTGHRFDAAHARRDAAFGDDGEQPDGAGRTNVRASAELRAESGNLHDAYLVAVLLAEQGHRAGCDGLLRRDVDVRDDSSIPIDLLVHEALDAVEFLAGH